GPPDLLEATRNLRLLKPQALAREDRVRLGDALAPELVHEAREIVVALAARRAIGEMLGRRRIDGVAPAFDQITLVQSIVLQVPAEDHGFPPSSPRSFRAARNKWTRTVDSFNPVMMLISR